MTKKELIDTVAARIGNDTTKRDAEAVIDATFQVVAEAIAADQRFAYPGFGTFTIRDRAARKGRNPRTGEAMKIKASRTIGFKPAPGLKDVL